jgi:hypothetical protein
MNPQVRDPKTRKKTAKLENCQNELVGIGGRTPTSIWINTPPLGINGLHCIEYPHQVRKFLLNLVPSEPLVLVQDMLCFDNSIKLDPLVSGALDLCFDNIITGCLLHEVKVDIYWCQLLCYIRGVQ